jgi:hypothetical protein
MKETCSLEGYQNSPARPSGIVEDVDEDEYEALAE